MKKSLLGLTCFLSIFLYSCASNVSPAEPLIEAAPELEELDSISEAEENSVSNEINIENTEDDSESIDSMDNPENEDIENTEDIVENSEESPVYEETEEPEITDFTYELDDIEEPVVITLEPVDTPKEIIEENSVPEEPVEIEVPPAIDETETSDILEITNEDINDETQETVDTDVIIVSEDTEDAPETIDADNQDTIDITEDNSEDSMDYELVTEEIIPSRKVTMKKQEYVDIVYPGTGWIYMGLTDNSKDLSYFGRKLGTSDTKFTLQARNAGTKIVHFYKDDALTNQYIDDYIEIEILPEKGSNKTHIEAPAYQQPNPKKKNRGLESEVSEIDIIKDIVPAQANKSSQTLMKEENNQDNKNKLDESKDVEEAVNNVITTNELDETENLSTNNKPDTNTLLKEAQLLYNEREYKAALDKLSLFFEYATSKRDEGLFLQGQILEAKSNIQDIKTAMEAYTTLIKNHPASKYWEDANKRIIYLKRFYFGG